MIKFSCATILLCASIALSKGDDMFSATNPCSSNEPKYFENMISNLHSSRIVCPGDKNQTCAEGYTCCKGRSDEYNCCPHLEANCCNDQIHCCPKGSSCDPAGGRCIKDNTYSGVNSLTPLDDITCPGNEFKCPSKTTCCKVSGGQYGCCPFEEATCCPDQMHCCPLGYECGPQNTCVHPSKFVNL